MFAHGLGMGLFEATKLRWLEEKEWRDCGYNVQIKDHNYYLSREPLRRFEDLDDDFESIKIVKIEDSFSISVVRIIRTIIEENPTVSANDIGIILLDNTKDIYELADRIELAIQQNFSWPVNKAYETKEKIADHIFISNRNNVKGLEFPFVVCITKQINNSPSYRNALYTMLTRSFIKSFLLTQPKSLTTGMEEGLKIILDSNQMVIQEPSEEEKEKIRTRFKNSENKLSHYELMQKIFKALKVEKKNHDKFFQLTQQMDMLESDERTLTEFIQDNLKYLRK